MIYESSKKNQLKYGYISKCALGSLITTITRQNLLGLDLKSD
jgi:hypothetical protein